MHYDEMIQNALMKAASMGFEMTESVADFIEHQIVDVEMTPENAIRAYELFLECGKECDCRLCRRARADAANPL
jgi:hypothetical protein